MNLLCFAVIDVAWECCGAVVRMGSSFSEIHMKVCMCQGDLRGLNQLVTTLHSDYSHRYLISS